MFGDDLFTVVALRLKSLFLVQKFLHENGVADRKMQDLICQDEYVNKKNAEGLSALHYAYAGQYQGACLLLLNEGADVNMVTSLVPANGGCNEILKQFGWGGWTPLLIAAEKGANHVNQYLKERAKLRDVFSWKAGSHSRTATSTPPASWLKKKIIFYLNVQEIRWTWVSSSDQNGLSITDGKLTVTRNRKL